jgi:tellurite resistance protein TehA-like permease
MREGLRSRLATDSSRQLLIRHPGMTIEALKEAIERLHPAYFAMVMATGIVSIAARLLDMGAVADALFVLNVLAFVLLWLLTVIRLVVHPRRMLDDLMDHQRGVGFFTTVAGTCVLGSQFVVLRGDHRTASLLWFLGIALWVLLIYAVFTGLTVKEVKPSLADGINGGWLVAVVATQSVSILGCLLLPRFHGFEEPLLFVAASFWLCGGMLYLWMISLIFYRYTFFRFLPSDLTPPYWINMGAMAISTLAGATLIANAGSAPFLQKMLPFLLGFTVFFWAAATWWIPMLVILGFWRHVYKKFPLSYDPLYWGAVFPLGMYTACTFQLARVAELPFLLFIPRGFIFVALLAWGATFAGLLHRLASASKANGAR